MKKLLLMITLLGMLILPLNLNAAPKGYTTKNLEEVLTEEEIEHNLSKYKENDKQVVIYMFRGSGCGYCKQFLTFLNSIVDEYGEYFKLESFEVWSDSNNQDLMKKVSTFLGESISGVPFIIIGDQTFPGYSTRYDDAIKEAIKTEYERKDKYDIFEEIEKKEKEEAAQNKPTRTTMVIYNAIFVIIGTVAVIYLNDKKSKEINERLDNIESMLKEKNKESKDKEKSKTNKLTFMK